MYDIFKICRTIKRFLVLSLGFPAYRPEYIERFIEAPTTSPHELQEYLDVSQPIPTRTRNLLIVWSCLFYVRTVSFPSFIFMNLNTHDLASNVHTTAENYYSFLCLTTNCSRLSGAEESEAGQSRAGALVDQLARDFFNLPLFSLCAPTRSQFHDPFQYLDSFGLLMSSILGVCLALAGIVLPLIQSLRPTATPFMMFIVAPMATRQVVVDRIKELYMDMSESYQNYCLTLIRRKMNQTTTNQLYYPSGQDVGPQSRNHHSPVHHTLDYPSTMRPLFVPGPEHHSRESKHPAPSNQFAWDCLTSTRSIWWRHKLASSFVQAAAFNTFVFIMFFILAYPYSMHLGHLKRHQLDSMAEQVAQLNCSIWFNDHHESGGQKIIIKLNELSLDWNWLFLGQLVGQAWPALCLTLFCTYYYACNVELANWLAETQLQLQICLEFAREVRLRMKKLAASVAQPNVTSLRPGGAQETKRDKRFNMQPIRLKHKRLTKIFFLLLNRQKMGTNNTTTSSEFQFKLAIEQFVSESRLTNWNELRSNDDYLDAQVEMMQKVYISYRVLVEHVHLYAPAIAVMIILMNILNYSYLFNSIWYVRTLPGFLYEPILTVVGGWFGAIFFIVLPSNFHAKSKKLQQVIWSIVAETSDSNEDLRMEHLRVLWLKHLSGSNMNGGGLVLKAFNIRITYVNIIQMLVWTATILVVALRM